MTTGLFYTTRSPAGREGQAIMAHMSVLETQCSTIDYLTANKTTANKQLIEHYARVSINDQPLSFRDFYLSEAKNMPDWATVYENLDVSTLAAYDKLYLIGGLDLWRSKLTRNGNRREKFPNDTGHLKFESTGIHLCHILALLKAHREYGISLHELAYDPNELPISLFHKDVSVNDNYHLYHGYNIKSYNISRLDSLQYYFSTLPIDVFEVEKSTDFTFGYTVLERSGREKYVSYINNLASQFNYSNVYVKNQLTGEDSTVRRDKYLEKIKESKYTLMLPSYDVHCFSIYRFIESLYHDCIPLIHPECNISEVEQSYAVDLSKLVRTTPFAETQRTELLAELKEKFLPFRKGFINNETTINRESQ